MGYNIYGGKKVAVARRGGLFHWMQHGDAPDCDKRLICEPVEKGPSSNSGRLRRL